MRDLLLPPADVRVVVEVVSDLGRVDYAVAPVSERPREELVGPSVAVGVRRVEEGDTEIMGAVQQAQEMKTQQMGGGPSAEPAQLPPG